METCNVIIFGYFCTYEMIESIQHHLQHLYLYTKAWLPSDLTNHGVSKSALFGLFLNLTWVLLLYWSRQLGITWDCPLFKFNNLCIFCLMNFWLECISRLCKNQQSLLEYFFFFFNTIFTVVRKKINQCK